MQFANLDMVVRRTLLERNLPIHFYSEILFHQSSAIRELNKDSLKIINTVNLPVNSYFAIDLPDDFQDDVAVCMPIGNLLQPIPKNNAITPLRVHDTSGNFVPYTDFALKNGESFLGFPISWSWFWNVSDWGEPTGRFFGSNGGAKKNGYAVFKERGQIQLNETFTAESAILLYVSNGQSIDNATRVDWNAFKSIQAYSDWQRSPNAAIDRSPEAMTWWNARRHFRANSDDLTTTDIRQIVHKSYTATMKN